MGWSNLTKSENWNRTPILSWINLVRDYIINTFLSLLKLEKDLFIIISPFYITNKQKLFFFLSNEKEKMTFFNKEKPIWVWRSCGASLLDNKYILLSFIFRSWIAFFFSKIEMKKEKEERGRRELISKFLVLCRVETCVKKSPSCKIFIFFTCESFQKDKFKKIFEKGIHDPPPLKN